MVIKLYVSLTEVTVNLPAGLKSLVLLLSEVTDTHLHDQRHRLCVTPDLERRYESEDSELFVPAEV